jgi:hypothetical protein
MALPYLPADANVLRYGRSGLDQTCAEVLTSIRPAQPPAGG